MRSIPNCSRERRSSIVYATLLALLLFAPFTRAGSFQVNPVRVDLSATTQSAAITIRNDGAEPVTIQTSVVAWSQSEGKDQYTETRDALATPPLATIPAGAQQIVRVGLRRPPDPTQELPFRLYVQEVPAREKPGFTGLQVALRVGIPVFVAPQAPLQRKLDWSGTLRADGTLELVVANRGNVHFQAAELRIVSPSTQTELARENGLAYVLAGESRTWRFKLTSTVLDSNAVQVQVFGDAGELDFPVTLAR